MADTLDLISLAEAKLAINFSGDTSQDTEFASYVTAASRLLDALVGPVVVRTLTDELYDGGRHAIWLLKKPVTSITAVTEYTGTAAQVLAAETNSTKTANDYLPELASGLLRRRANGADSRFPSGRRNVKVTYVAGRAADTASVDARFKQAAAMTFLHLWRRDQGAGSVIFGEGEAPVPAGFAVPRAVAEMLSDQLLVPGLA